MRAYKIHLDQGKPRLHTLLFTYEICKTSFVLDLVIWSPYVIRNKNISMIHMHFGL